MLDKSPSRPVASGMQHGAEGPLIGVELIDVLHSPGWDDFRDVDDLTERRDVLNAGNGWDWGLLGWLLIVMTGIIPENSLRKTHQ